MSTASILLNQIGGGGLGPPDPSSGLKNGPPDPSSGEIFSKVLGDIEPKNQMQIGQVIAQDQKILNPASPISKDEPVAAKNEAATNQKIKKPESDNALPSTKQKPSVKQDLPSSLIELTQAAGYMGSQFSSSAQNSQAAGALEIKNPEFRALTEDTAKKISAKPLENQRSNVERDVAFEAPKRAGQPLVMAMPTLMPALVPAFTPAFIPVAIPTDMLAANAFDGEILNKYDLLSIPGDNNDTISSYQDTRDVHAILKQIESMGGRVMQESSGISQAYRAMGASEDFMKVRSDLSGKDKTSREGVESDVGVWLSTQFNPVDQQLGQSRMQVAPLDSGVVGASASGFVGLESRPIDPGRAWDLAAVIQTLNAKGSGSVKLKLHPEVLGEMEVSLEQKRGIGGKKDLLLNFTTTTQQAKEALLESVHELKKSLKSRDSQIGQVEINLEHLSGAGSKPDLTSIANLLNSSDVGSHGGQQDSGQKSSQDRQNRQENNTQSQWDRLNGEDSSRNRDPRQGRQQRDAYRYYAGAEL